MSIGNKVSHDKVNHLEDQNVGERVKEKNTAQDIEQNMVQNNMLNNRDKQNKSYHQAQNNHQYEARQQDINYGEEQEIKPYIFQPKPTGLNFEEELLIEKSKNNEVIGVDFDQKLDKIHNRTGQKIREEINLPCLSEPEVARHFVRLSQKNYSIDSGFYPLGSCTMKYNPRVNEKLANLSGFANIHPYQDEATVQGALALMFELQQWLADLSGLPHVALSPAAGAHGEFAGMMVIKKAHRAKNRQRKYVLIPDSAHGTNPATAVICGYQTITLATDELGLCSLDELKQAIEKYGEDIAAIMLTNPNTCGKFDKNILKIAELVHSVGAYFYCDGANFNAIVGRVKPSDFGVDVMHFNLHKTFSTPHGGGGPGSGPIAVTEELGKYIPTPFVKKLDNKDDDSDENGDMAMNQHQHQRFTLVTDTKDTIGKIKGFYGHFSMFVRAFAYMLSYGAKGLKQVAEDAVLNANYVAARLKQHYHIAFKGYCMHECLLTDKKQKKLGADTMDIAKTLIEFGFHPMTVYFPLVIKGAMLIEPTETEGKRTLDKFVETMIWIAKEIEKGNVAKLKQYPKSTPRKRVDEVLAAKELKLSWHDLNLS